MPPTTAQRTDLRLLSGDNKEPYDLTNDQIDALYDRASGDEALTLALILQRRHGIASNYVSMQTDAGPRMEWQQKQAHIKELLTYWEKKAGTVGAIMGAGVIDLNLDTEIS
jgi:hypothetical protein